MRATLQYKWDSFGRALFLQELLIEVLRALLVLTFAFLSEALHLNADRYGGGNTTDVSIVNAWRTVLDLSDMEERMLPEQVRHSAIWLFIILWTAVFSNASIRLCKFVIAFARHTEQQQFTSLNKLVFCTTTAQILACLTPLAYGNSAYDSQNPHEWVAGFQAFALFGYLIKLLSYFRGNLALGSFIYKIEQIAVALGPVSVSSLVLMLAFSFPILLLLAEERKDWYSAFGFTMTTFNRALRLPTIADFAPMTATIGGDSKPSDGDERRLDEHSEGYEDRFPRHLDPENTWWPVVVVYEIFVVFGQIFLLNMMIGIVGAANMSVHLNADRVARFERALLILDKEQQMLKERINADAPQTTARRKWIRRCEVCCDALIPKFLQTHRITANDLRPAWLHVMLPPATGETLSGDGAITEHADIAALQRKLGRV